MHFLATSWTHEQESSHVLIAVLVTMLAAGEVGYRAGRRNRTPHEGGRGHFVAVQASLLGLLALLLGFALNMADQRYEARRASTMDDSISLATLNLRSDFLPEPSRTEFKRLLLDYLGSHLEAVTANGADATAQFPHRAERAEALHRRMSEFVRATVQGDSPIKGAAEMIPALGDSLAIHRRWVTAMETQVPQQILILLFATAVAAAGVVGYSGGLSQHRGIVQSMLLAVFVSGIVFVIHDLDTPRSGVSQSSSQPLVHLKSIVESEVTPP